jgi:hypothetical protein
MGGVAVLVACGNVAVRVGSLDAVGETNDSCVAVGIRVGDTFCVLATAEEGVGMPGTLVSADAVQPVIEFNIRSSALQVT